jgi:hypothetical protein
LPDEEALAEALAKLPPLPPLLNAVASALADARPPRLDALASASADAKPPLPPTVDAEASASAEATPPDEKLSALALALAVHAPMNLFLQP